MVAQYLPGGGRRRHTRSQPGLLGGADHLAGRVRAGRQARHIAANTTIGITKAVVLLVAPFNACIHHVQAEQVAKIEAAVDLQQVTGIRRADRHPLVVNAGGNALACCPVALGGGVVVLGTRHVGVVGELMVIPHRDPRHLGVQGLQVHIRAVQRVAGAVVVQAHHVIGGHDHAAQTHRIFVAELGGVGAVFIQVIAQVHGVLGI